MRRLKIVFFVFLSLFGLSTNIVRAQLEDRSGTLEKFETLFANLSAHYVDSVNGVKLVEDAINGMLSKLDPHSVYIPSEELEEMNAPLVGNFEGIGIRFNIFNDTILVVNPIPGGPSEKLGIMAGDKIVTIEGKIVAGVGIKNKDVMESLRGKKGTKVSVGIKRKRIVNLMDYTITRDKIPINSIDAVYMVNSKVGYVKLNRFAASSLDEFKTALATLKEQGMKDLIFDLRGNGGGYLKTAINMTDEFLDGNKLIVYTEGRSYPRENVYAKTKGDFEKGRLVVLIDEGSASASEIVSGAIQDWDRGVVVGRRSFGKGLVQRPFMLPDGSAVRLTISRYYTPSGRSIQKPYDKGRDAYIKEKYERYLNGEVFHKDSIDFPDSLRFYTSKKRQVYGGGGIMPDIFVPLDTTETSDYFVNLRRNGIFNRFTLEYLNKNRQTLNKKYPDVKSFKKGFEIDNAFLDDVAKYAKDEEEIEIDKEDAKRSERIIKTWFKAYIASNLFDYSSFYEIMNPLDASYNEAIDILEGKRYKELKIDG